MMGRNHVIVGICALEHAYVASTMVNRIGLNPLLYVQYEAQSYLGLTEMSIFTASLCGIGYLIGNLLPDIDNPNSMLGKAVHIPVEHRTWLHAIYLYLIIAALGFSHPVFAWMFFGVFVHLFWDSFSACGNCWFYKIFSDYHTYPNGAKIKKGHKLKLYHTGEWSEYLLVFIIVAVSVVSYILLKRY